MMKLEFVDHTINWYKGEYIEGGMVIIWGAFLLIMSLYFKVYDRFDSTHKLIIPLLIAGLIWFLAGNVGLIVNINRIQKAKIEYSRDKEAFVKSEKTRVEKFIGTYKYLLAGWSIAIVIGLVLFNFTSGSLSKAIGLSLILFSTLGLIVDLTSEQNAKAYYEQIQLFSVIQN